jgi:hypothetical protein
MDCAIASLIGGAPSRNAEKSISYPIFSPLEAFAFGANDISIAHRHNKAILVDSGRGSATEPILDRHYRKQMQKFRINKEACDCSYSLSSQMGVGNGKGFLCSALTFLSGL